MSDERIPLARPVLGEREEELVLEVIRSGMLSLGPMLPRFEEDLAARIGVPADLAVGVSSGTTALHLAVREQGWGPGDEILQRHIEQHQPGDEIIAAGFDPETVRKVLRMVRISEFKRKQAAPGLKVTDRAFGTGWRMPIAARLTEPDGSATV